MANIPTVEELLHYLDKTLSSDRAIQIELLLKSKSNTSIVVSEMLNGLRILKEEQGSSENVLNHIAEATKEIPPFSEELSEEKN